MLKLRKIYASIIKEVIASMEGNAKNITELKCVKFRAVPLNPAETVILPSVYISTKMGFVSLAKDAPMFMLGW